MQKLPVLIQDNMALCKGQFATQLMFYCNRIKHYCKNVII